MEFASKLMERTGKGYVSYSALKYAADGSRQQDMKLFELYMCGLLKKESDALTFGGLYDTLLLEPETVTDKYYVIYDDKQIGLLTYVHTDISITVSVNTVSRAKVPRSSHRITRN